MKPLSRVLVCCMLVRDHLVLFGLQMTYSHILCWLAYRAFSLRNCDCYPHCFYQSLSSASPLQIKTSWLSQVDSSVECGKHLVAIKSWLCNWLHAQTWFLFICTNNDLQAWTKIYNQKQPLASGEDALWLRWWERKGRLTDKKCMLCGNIWEHTTTLYYNVLEGEGALEGGMGEKAGAASWANLNGSTGHHSCKLVAHIGP